MNRKKLYIGCFITFHSAKRPQSMDPGTIEKMKSSGRLNLPFWRKLDHYFIVIFLLIAPVMTTYSLIEYYLLDTYNGVRTPSELASTGYIWLIPAVAFIYIQWYRLNFKQYEISANPDQIQKALEKTIVDLEWRIEKNDEDLIRAFCKGNLASWGEMITIIPLPNKLLINSICDPNKKTSVVSYGMNKLNVATFVNHLRNEVNGASSLELEEHLYQGLFTRRRANFLIYSSSVLLGLFAIIYLIPTGQFLLAVIVLLIPAYYIYTGRK